MSAIAVTTGAALIGWLIPEFILVLSPHADGFKRIELGINIASATGFGLIAFGITAHPL